MYLYSETPCVHMEFWGVIMAMFSPAMSWVILPHQGMEGIWLAACPAPVPLWLVLLWFGAFLGAD